MNKYFAEFLGTFTLTLVVLLSLGGQFPVPTPILAALTVGVYVYTVGAISGAQFNPAVTIGAWSVGKMKLSESIYYIVSQFIASVLAFIIFGILGFHVPSAAAPTISMGVGELIGTAVLTFGIATVVFGKTDKLLSGFVIGASLLIGISLAGGMGSAGALNPAVSTAIGVFNPIYVVGQVAGGVLGFWIYKLLIKAK